MKIENKNQLHPPRPKRKRVDAQGNDRRRVYVKDHNSTMLLCEGLTRNGAAAFISAIRDYANKLGTKLETNFIITQ